MLHPSEFDFQSYFECCGKISCAERLSRSAEVTSAAECPLAIHLSTIYFDDLAEWYLTLLFFSLSTR